MHLQVANLKYGQVNSIEEAGRFSGINDELWVRMALFFDGTWPQHWTMQR